MSGRRAFVFVIDACGVGELPDAASYGDAGANTLAHVADAVGGLQLPVMERLGLGSILPLAGVAEAAEPALHGRLAPLGAGKDSTAGHWELMGVVSAEAPPTYPNGLPPRLLWQVEQAIGRSVICNRPYNGIAAIDDYGERHLHSGAPILYTSADSVVQLAAHIQVMSESELYEACRAVRALMTGPNAVGRVIARPFEGHPGAFARTLGRHDFALAPPSRSYLDELREHGCAVHGVGKVFDLFAGVGFDESHPGATNHAALSSARGLFESLSGGFVFVNLIETDQRFGHRKDTAGFHAALQEIDGALGTMLERRGPDDLVIVTADHGCDPALAHSDHTREYAPLLAVFPGCGGRHHDGALADVGASVLRWLCNAEAPGLPGEPFT
jgi:phosphopentomutase